MYHRRVALDELHSLTDAEIARLPGKPGIYMLFQVQIPLHADAARNLRQGLRAARSSFPRATHFAVEVVADAEAAGAKAVPAMNECGGARRATGGGARRGRSANQRAMSQRALGARLRQIRKELGRVRAATFVGPLAGPER